MFGRSGFACLRFLTIYCWMLVAVAADVVGVVLSLLPLQKITKVVRLQEMPACCLGATAECSQLIILTSLLMQFLFLQTAKKNSFSNFILLQAAITRQQQQQLQHEQSSSLILFNDRLKAVVNFQAGTRCNHEATTKQAITTKALSSFSCSSSSSSSSSMLLLLFFLLYSFYFGFSYLSLLLC